MHVQSEYKETLPSVRVRLVVGPAEHRSVAVSGLVVDSHMVKFLVTVVVIAVIVLVHVGGAVALLQVA